MRKRNLLIHFILSISLSFAFLSLSCGKKTKVFLHASADYQNETSIDLNNLSKEVVKNNGDAIILKDMEVNLLQGNVLGKINRFENYITNGESVLISDTEQFEGEKSAAFEPWRFKTTSASSAIFEIKANADIQLSITHPAITGGWIDEYGQYFALYVKVEDKVYMQWSKDIKSLPVEANAYGGEVMLKQGDIAYYVFGSTIANERNVQTIPAFTSFSENYDETIRDSQLEFSGSETINMWDALTATINNDYLPVLYNSISFGFYYGTILDYQAFSYHEGLGEGKENDALWNQVAHGDGGTGFLRWQIQCDEANDAIMVIKALYDTQVHISHTAIWDDPWSTHTAVRYYGMDEEENKLLIKEYPIVANSGADYFALTVNLKANEALIIDYYTMNGQWGSLNFAPMVTSSTTDFDATNTLDFSIIKALASLKVEKISQLDALFASLDEEDYSLNNWGNIENYYTEAVLTIRSAQDEQTLLNAYESAVNDISQTKTIVQENEELIALKNEKIAELEAYFNALKKKDYSEENYALIAEKVEEFKNKIKNATSKTSVNTLYKNVLSQIEKIEKKQGGCQGNVTGSLILFIGLFKMALDVKKKQTRV